MLNIVAIMGRLVRDPELKTTQSGTSVCSFTIVCDRSYTAKGEERKADFIDIVAWRQTAEFVCKYFSKGSLIAIDGRLQTTSYQDKNGSNRTRTEVVANNVSFAGPKASDKPSVQSFDQQTANSVREANAAQNAPQEPPRQMSFSSQRQREEWRTAEAVPATASVQDEFAVITDEEDLPF